MGEEDVEEIEECHLVVNRVDNLRQYGFNCVKTNTFGDVRSRLAKFEDKNS